MTQVDVKLDDGEIVVGRFCEQHDKDLHQYRNMSNTRPYVREDMTDQTQTHETPEEHSDVVGGSTAARRIGCPRSYALEKLVPPDPGSSYAREGTALHEMMAIILDKDMKPGELLPFTFKREGHDVEGDWKFTVDAELWADLGQPALDAFDNFIDDIEKETGAEFDYIVETRCEMPGIPGAFGTSDVIWKCGKYSGVWDWKFGRKEVSAERNKQLMFYARAAANSAPAMFFDDDHKADYTWGNMDPEREVILSIMQPKCSDEPSEYIVTVAELEEFRVELMDAVKTAEQQGEKAPVAKGGWCDFATCKAVCPLHAGQTAVFGEKMARLGQLAKEQDVPVAEVEGEVAGIPLAFADMLPDLLDLAEDAEKWIAEVRKAANRVLDDDPEAIPGWMHTEKKTSKRVWAVEEDEVRKFMKNRRYTLDDYAPRKMLTMPQAEKLLKRDGRTIPEEMIEKDVTVRVALVRADGENAPLQTTAERAAEVGQKLAALGGE